MRVIISIIFSLSCLILTAQDTNKFKRKISVDGTYLLSFFKTEDARITPLNIKFPLNKKCNFRTGFNIETSTASNKGVEGDLKIGIEIPHQYSEKWSYYYGTDINCAYYNYNDQDNSILIYSFIPFFGFEVYFSKEFSLSYEPKLIFSHYKYDGVVDDIYEEEIRLTGLSQFFINFNF